MNKNTTNLKDLKSNILPYTWGEIITIHEVAIYSIIEYKNKDGNILFNPYLRGDDTRHSFNSFDKAMIFVISLKHLKNINEADYSVRFICKMIESYQ